MGFFAADWQDFFLEEPSDLVLFIFTALLFCAVMARFAEPTDKLFGFLWAQSLFFVRFLVSGNYRLLIHGFFEPLIVIGGILAAGCLEDMPEFRW